MRLRAAAALSLAALLTFAAPLAGLAISGRPVAAFLVFPPRTQAVAQAPFDWGVFLVMSLPVLAAFALLLAAIARARPAQASAAAGKFPWWGWLGAGLIATAWSASWADLVPEAMRWAAFTLLWTGYILVMNGLAFRRAGSCLLTGRSAWLLGLFPLSAGFWWLFEHLNQFVNNWHYVGTGAESDWDYFVRATLPFSTVLPAVASTWAWLAGSPRVQAMALPPVGGHPALAWAALASGAFALAAIGLRPDLLFPMLWIAPLLLLAGLQHLACGETIFTEIARGDWRPVLQSALAALVCGFFWELWNWGSAARWHYTVPYVQRFHLFEMPALGYAGYLPFGIVCALVTDLAARTVDGRPAWPLENDSVAGYAPPGSAGEARRANG
jgi:hypothetical protein